MRVRDQIEFNFQRAKAEGGEDKSELISVL